MATPLELEKFRRIEFSQGRWITRAIKTPKLMRQYAREAIALVGILFPITTVALGVTFLNVIFRFAVTCVRNGRMCHIILQLYPSAVCQITPLTKTKTEILKMQFGPFCASLKMAFRIVTLLGP